MTKTKDNKYQTRQQESKNMNSLSTRQKPIILVTILLTVLFFAKVSLAVYDVPSERRTIWAGKTGLDPVGGIPNYPSVTCTGLDPTGNTDNTSQINACIAAASPGTAVYIPAGVYKVSGQINMKSNVVLRGAGAEAPWLPSASPRSTTLNISRRISFDGGNRTTSWSPGASQGTSITAGYTTGSTQITLSDASNYNVGNVISIFQNNDSAVINSKGYGWLGEDDGTGQRVLQQYSTITAKNGNVLTIDPPISYVSPSPVNPAVRKQTFNLVMAGLEDLKLNRASGSDMYLIFCRFIKNCWFKNIETYNSGSNGSGSPHIWMQFSYQCEIRDSYFHTGESHDSGRNYGIEFYHWNSSHKAENNIIRDTRHSIAFEGGGSNCALLYNYTDDNWESVQGSGTVRDSSFLSEDTSANHGAHPHMNLWEGNSVTDWWSDYTQGSASHMSFFRNNVRCKNTTLSMNSNPWLWVCIEIETYNYYNNIVGNVIGQSSFTGGTVVNNGGGGATPHIYRFGYSSAGGSHTDSQSYSTAIKHGNYDFVTDGVAHWDGGADHSLLTSMYYNSKPAWWGNTPWPAIGPDVAGLANDIPAKIRYQGETPLPVCGNSQCEQGETCSSCSEDCGTCPVYFQPNQYIQAESGTLSSPLQTGTSGSDTYVYTPTDNQGSVSFTFSITTAGQYKMEARVNSNNDAGQNSFYVGLDNEPAQGNSSYTFGTVLTSMFVWDDVNRKGSGGTSPEFDPMVWTLSAGIHTFTFSGRESNSWLDQIRLVPYADTTPPATPTGLTVN